MLKALRHLTKNFPGNKGFTLIELMVVFTIIGVLAAVTMPNLLRQIGKARESEIKNALGTVARAQMGFHWENQTFCCTASTSDQILTRLGVDVSSTYITSWDFNLTTLSTQITFATNNSNWANDGTRGFSGGVFFDSSTSEGYQSVICQSYEPGLTTVSPVTAPPECGTNAIRLR